MADITKAQVVEFIEKMTVLELAELVKELEEKFGVSAAAPVAVAAAPAAGAAPAAEEKDEFDVVLASAGDKKINVIKEVRAVTGLGLKEASHFLRNIGRGEDLAILDRHILRNLLRHRVIGRMPKSLTPKRYLVIEERMEAFSEAVGISLGALGDRPMGPIRRTLGQEGPRSVTRMRSTRRARRETQKLPRASTGRDNASLAKSRANSVTMRAVGTLWRTASRTEASSLSEMRKR